MIGKTDPRDARIAELESQLEKVHQQLLQAQKMNSIGVLAASITHEFNNILTTIINYAKMGLRHKDAATRDKSFDKILMAGQRAAKITTGMLSYARQQSDRRENMDLVTLVEDVLILVEKDLQRFRIELITDFTRPTLALVNSGQVQQVLLNLIVNARQVMESGGRLTIGVRTNRESGHSEISVRDTGCGIPADKLRMIFEPFFTTKTADDQGQGGTGLGLSLARDVMESHGGRIRVESAVGTGTTFTLKFPIPVTSSPTSTSTTKPLQKVG
ncbi:MAG: sensor histidine kinase [Planctomycetes bacterium]|nr:sensor histidine kinase [Planctomycetota bacterium]